MSNSNIVTLSNNKDQFNTLAQAMGMGADMAVSKKQKSNLARLKIDHFGVDGETTIKGKKKTIKAVEPGCFSLELPDGDKIYQTNPKIRLFQQKFMYKRYVNGNGDNKGMFIKTIMANDLKSDLVDNTGGVNCGKPSGWIEDYDSLPDSQKQLIKSIKRVRVLFGLATFDDAIDNEGLDVDSQESVPFIYEVDNRDAFKTMGVPIGQMAKQNRILPQHWLELGTEERSIPTGAKYFVPSVQLLPNIIELKEEDQNIFTDFADWIENYNSWVSTSNQEAVDVKRKQQNDKVVDEFVDIDTSSKKDESIPF